MKELEKAKELLQQFTDTILSSGNTVSKPMIKQCAIIAVDEILKSYEETNSHYGTVYKY